MGRVWTLGEIVPKCEKMGGMKKQRRGSREDIPNPFLFSFFLRLDYLFLDNQPLCRSCDRVVCRGDGCPNNPQAKQVGNRKDRVWSHEANELQL